MAPPIIVDDLEVKRGGWTSIELSGNQYSPLQIPEAASESLGSLVSSVLTFLYTTVCIETEDNTNGNGHEAFLMFLYNNYPPPPLKSNMGHCTEVGRAFLIHFQKIFLNKVLLMMKIAKKLNFISEWLHLVVKVSKSAKKCSKKIQFGVISGFSKIKFALANLIHINSYIVKKEM